MISVYHKSGILDSTEQKKEKNYSIRDVVMLYYKCENVSAGEAFA